MEGHLPGAASRQTLPWSPGLVEVTNDEANERMKLMKIGPRWGGGGMYSKGLRHAGAWPSSELQSFI